MPTAYACLITALAVACAAPGKVTVTEAHAQRALSLAMGQELVVRLASNPTTGYRWTLLDTPDPVLALVSPAVYTQAAASAGALGAGGTEEWRFSAVKPGAQALSFEYRRPWERDTAAERTISFPVTVR